MNRLLAMGTLECRLGRSMPSERPQKIKHAVIDQSEVLYRIKHTWNARKLDRKSQFRFSVKALKRLFYDCAFLETISSHLTETKTVCGIFLGCN